MRELKKERADDILRISKACIQPFREIYRGIRLRTISIYYCLTIGLGLELFLLTNWDYNFFKKLHLQKHYPTGFGYLIYVSVISLLGFLVWGIKQTMLREKLAQKLTQVFSNSGFKNAIGKLPAFISDFPIDDFSRKLRVTNAGFPLAKFKNAKESLEAGLQVYVDDIKEDRGKGAVDIVYSHEPMPRHTVVENILALKPYKFVIGRTRSRQITTSLSDSPHLLVGGQTGGGKSTLLRQIVTTLYVNQPKTEFILIDLKGGLEFQLFEGIPGIEVIGDLDRVASELALLDSVLNKRMEALKAAQCKDIAEYVRRNRAKASQISSRNVPNNRIVVVVDEAAEMFLVHGGSNGREIEMAKRTLSRVARIGRAIGVHLVVATQRPDKQALSPQIKANLTGVVCFPMQNDASSISVLGNGRATDLPDIPGRAIWKNGPAMVEVQTPYMSPSDVEEILKAYKADKEVSSANQEKQ